MPQRPTPRPSRAPSKSKRPMPRPSTREEREAGERGDRAARRDAGMKSGGKVKKMAGGGTNRSATAQRRQAETRRRMATSPRGMSTEERQGLERSNAASQGVGPFPGTAGDKSRRRKTEKKAKGGMCRGMGAASRGGKYRSS